MAFPVPYNVYTLPTPQFGNSGNYASVNDAYTTPATSGPYPDVTFTGQPLVQPGSRVRIFSSATGHPIVLAYVRYNPTASVSLSATNVPGLVYWKAPGTDGFTVTPTYSEGPGSGVLGFEAGILLNAGVTAGNWTWIQTGGLCTGVNTPASTTNGDGLQGGSATALVLTRVAAATLASAYLPGIIALGIGTRTSNQNTIMLQQIGML